MKSIKTIVLLLLCLSADSLYAQHWRIFACVIANDSAGAFMGGSSNGSGLYQSDDMGETWKHLGWDNIKCYSMCMDPSSNGRILYEATGLGVLRSSDYGETWKQITDWRMSEAMDIEVNDENPNELYVATAHGSWKTEDGGKSWQKYDSMNMYCNQVSLDDSLRPVFTASELYKEDGRAEQIDAADVSSKNLIYVSSQGGLPVVLISTLGNGVYKGYVTRDSHSLQYQNTLRKRQVWKLSWFQITP